MLSRPLAPQGRRTPPSWPPRPSTTAAGWPPSGPWPMLPPRLPPARASGRRTWPPSGPPWLLAGAAHDPLDSTSSVLSVGTQQRAVALLLKESETFEALGSRFPQASPVSHGLALAKRQGLPRVVLLRGPQVRLYSARTPGWAARDRLRPSSRSTSTCSDRMPPATCPCCSVSERWSTTARSPRS